MVKIEEFYLINIKEFLKIFINYYLLYKYDNISVFLVFIKVKII